MYPITSKLLKRPLKLEKLRSTPEYCFQTPFGMGAMGGLPGMANLGMGSANFMEMQQRMQSEVGNLIISLQIGTN